ncbi:ead/Ea22-like family protein [Pseudomonas aeruginosa]|uniref:ead/Ea22-like family protein n=1 Tax=Pseudomonas aeruginosa TaxID=287 RepID=UPI001C2DBCD2|nr:ead/Ea22-like family protein [Pseudomonas aeruginosa]UHL99560.1 ead/Ea22-like family protein [Pseudomonas aeruginosa]
MTDHAELRRLAKAATPGPWSCNRHWAIVGGPTLEFTNGAAQQQIAMACWQSWMHEEELRNNAAFIASANPKTILALLDEIDGMKASGWRNHSVNYARAEKCPQTLETAQAAWDRDQELIEEQRQQIARDSQTINQLRQKLQSAEVDRDRLKAENYAYKDRQKRYEWLAEDLKECASALPGTEYMDPPDGGNVSIPEQIRRMAKDAARYRGLRDEGYLHNWASLHVCDEHLRAQRTDEAIDSVLNIGATQ